jgi:recombinational DNA repair ATPase RecF
MQDILLNYADNMKETNEKIINEMVKIRSILDQALHSRISQFDSRMVEITNEMENERVSMIEDFGIIMERAISDIMTTSAEFFGDCNGDKI